MNTRQFSLRKCGVPATTLALSLFAAASWGVTFVNPADDPRKQQ